MVDKLTPRQAQILGLIQDTIKNTGFPPTRAEIAMEMGFRSPNASEEHLRALERKGAVELLPGVSRGIRVLVKNRRRGLPVVEHIAAGEPVLAKENIAEYYRLDPALFRPRVDYFLRISGMGMRNVGILNGDLLAVHATQEARSGQIVVVRLNGEVAVKRYRRRGNKIRLIPEAPDIDPILVDLRERSLVIEGVVVGSLRTKAPI